ncbi:MAG: hypothetical protein IJS76_01670 [Pseudobutyrivibrio sp.]|nr:hypothetical protein [Pseudobutyrivibrio sp.]
MKKGRKIRVLIKKNITFLLCFSISLSLSNIMIAHASEKSINPSSVYKNLLSEPERNVYNQVYSALIGYDESLFAMIDPLSEKELEDTMNAIFNDHPEIFWANTSYKYAVDAKGIVHKIKLSYGINSSDLATAKGNFDRIISDLVAGANQYNNDLDKERYIFDSICSMNTYNVSNALNQSAYSALATGSSVCAGYARAFQLVCIQAGIPCYYVTGTSKGENHAWNIVQINGAYYNVDLTWDDCITEATGYSSYHYFNKNDLEFSFDHSRSPLSAQLMSCI